MKPEVCVVVPAYNEERRIEACIRSLLELNYPRDRLKLIFVDDCSTDSTPEIIKRYAAEHEHVLYLKTCGSGPSKARNLGAEVCDAEFVAFTDADCLVDREWLNELLRGFVSEDVAGVGGAQRSPDDEHSFGRRVQLFLELTGIVGEYTKSSQALAEVEHNPSCNSMYRRRVLLELGGFQEDLWPGEDVELDYRLRRAGYRLMYSPSAVVRHYRPQGWRAFARMMLSYGGVQAYLLRKYGFFRKLHYLPFVLLACTLLWGAAALAFPQLLLLPLVLVLLAFLRLLSISRSPADAAHVLALCMVAVVFWNLGFFSRLLRGEAVSYK
ncbi:MAG: glycosyltransferase [Euryarchaeota archaeon]|nr:glycosyltransferase [Euryarchaeota archaeon]